MKITLKELRQIIKEELEPTQTTAYQDLLKISRKVDKVHGTVELLNALDEELADGADKRYGMDAGSTKYFKEAIQKLSGSGIKQDSIKAAFGKIREYYRESVKQFYRHPGYAEFISHLNTPIESY